MDCLDADTIAAWMDGSLPERERAAAEAHAADCDRCLAVLAAVAKTTPPPQKAARPAWLSVRWLVPIATVAVAAVAWVLVQDQQPPVRTIDTIAVRQSDPAPAPVRSAEPKREIAPQANVVGGVTAEKRPAPNVVTAKRTPSESARRDEQARAREEAAKRELLEKLARDGLVPQTKTVAASPPPPVAEPTARPPAAPQTATAAARAPEQALVQNQFRSAAAPTLIVSSDPNMRWRISGSVVERSTDGGRTWSPQTIGVQTSLSAGASPAPGVCWIVGPGGTVLLTTDGERWLRLEFPDSNASLVAVAARDALSATVTAADGRTYRTDDGGKTWRVQESATAAF
jgi:hypothetical protein